MMNGKFFIKGIIHITRSEDNKVDFEVLEEHFFHNELEKNGNFLTQSDWDINLDYELRQEDWGTLEPEEGKCYAVLWQFNMSFIDYWTDCGMEYDSKINTVNLEFNLIDEENTKYLLRHYNE